MATTTYEEERRRPEYIPRQTYAPPTNTETQKAQADIDAAMELMRQRYAEAANPARQAEQDAKIQRGRQFWTGANLFANVIANYINAHGTANGAPNMTYNDAATQRMYETWKDADKQLRADRRDAQQRYDAMGLQQQQMRLDAAKAADKAALDAYNINFNNANADIADQNKQAQADYDYERKMADDLAKEERANKEWERRNAIQAQQAERLARIRHSGSGRSGSRTSPSAGASVAVGSMNIPVKDKNDAIRVNKDIANRIVEAQNRIIEEQNRSRRVTEQIPLLEKPENDKEAQNIIYKYGDLYDTDEAFRNGVNEAYGIKDPYAEEQAEPYFEQFGGRSVMPEDGYSMPVERRYQGSSYQNPRAFNTDRSASSSIPPYMRKQYTKK